MVKIIRKVPQLQVIVAGLMYGMTSISYIAALLFLVYYIFGIVAVLLFKENDPFNFATLPLAILTLFRVSTLDGWSDIMCAPRRPADRPCLPQSNRVASIGLARSRLACAVARGALSRVDTVPHCGMSHAAARDCSLPAKPTSSGRPCRSDAVESELSMQVHQHVRLPPVHVHG